MPQFPPKPYLKKQNNKSIGLLHNYYKILQLKSYANSNMPFTLLAVKQINQYTLSCRSAKHEAST